MRILIAPDSFKGSLSAVQAAESMAAGARAVFPDCECDLAPIADGGEGTVDALVAATGGEMRDVPARGPLGRQVRAAYGIFDKGGSAVAEMAAASGLPLVARHERDPRITCTFGTGEVIRAALADLHAAGHAGKSDARPTLIIGIGGSATNDGGSGALRALGVRFLDKHGRELPPGGAALKDLAAIDCSGLDPLLSETTIRVACDVDTPLCGERGASAVFGPQKGATPDMVRELDEALAHYADVARQTTGKDIAHTPGAGAAGGLGAGLLFFTGAKLEPGVDIVLDAIDFSARAARADLVITGEGASDVQTAYGKAPAGVAKIAKQHGKAVLCISGGLGPGVEAVYDHGIDAIFAAVAAPASLEECMEKAAPLLSQAAERVCRAVRVGMGMGMGMGRSR